MTSYHLMNMNDLGAMAMSSPVYSIWSFIEALLFKKILLEKYCCRIWPQVFDFFFIQALIQISDIT